MALLTRCQILDAPPKFEDIEVPEWGGAVRIRTLSGAVRMNLLDIIYKSEQQLLDYEAKDESERAHLPLPQRYDNALLTLLHTIIGEDGEPLFTVADYPAFVSLSYQTQTLLWQAFERLTVPRAEQKKSSGSTRRGGSSSASRSRSVAP